MVRKTLILILLSANALLAFATVSQCGSRDHKDEVGIDTTTFSGKIPAEWQGQSDWEGSEWQVTDQ